jgi:hypothetical protein
MKTDQLISIQYSHCADYISFFPSLQAGKASAATVISTIRSLRSRSKSFESIFSDPRSESGSIYSDDATTILDDDDTIDADESNTSLDTLFKEHRKE